MSKPKKPKLAPPVIIHEGIGLPTAIVLVLLVTAITYVWCVVL